MKYIKPFKLFESGESSTAFPSLGEIGKYLVNAVTTVNPVGTILLSAAMRLFPDVKENAKIRFIFPSKNWEAKALEFLKSLGLVTSIFKDWGQATAEAKKYVESGVKAKELVIGSHGDGKFLILPQKSAAGQEQQQDFLSSLKPLIKSDTVVFFTACHGADFLNNLVDAANVVSHPVYGAAGIYNYVSNSAEEGYWVCSPLPPNYKKVQVNLEKRDLIPQYVATPNNGLFSFIKGGASAKVEVLFKATALTKLGCTKVPAEGVTATFNLTDEDAMDKEARLVDRVEYHDAKGLPLYRFSLPSLYLDEYAKEWPFGELKKAKRLDFKYVSSSKTQAEAARAFSTGEIIVKVDGVVVGPKEVGVKKIQQYLRQDADLTTNAELLKRGICKKVATPPISWLTPGRIQ